MTSRFTYFSFLGGVLFALMSPATLAIQAVSDSYVIPADDTSFLNIFANDDIDFQTWDEPTDNDLEILEGQATVGFPDGFAITPAPGFTGTIRMRYTITDSSGSDQAIATFQVEASAPDFLAVDDLFTVAENAGAQTLDILDNDYTGMQSPTLDGPTTSAKGGTLVFNFSDVNYTPPADFTGLDSFTYEITDFDTGEVSTATVSVRVGEGVSVPGTTQEEQQVLNNLYQICTQDSSSGLPCDDIGSLTDSETRQLAQQAGGGQTRQQSRAMRQMRQQQTNNIQMRLGEIRGGNNQVSINGLNTTLLGQAVPLGKALQSEVNDALSGGSAGNGDFATPWGLFINGRIMLGKGTDDDRPKYDQDGFNITMGVDYRWAENIVVGVAAGFGQSELDFDGVFGSQDSSTYNLSVFGNYYPAENWYVDGLLMWIQGDLDMERGISVGPINQRLSGDTDSSQWLTAISAGYEISHKKWLGSVYGRLEYSDLTIDSYRESGGSLALSFSEQNDSSFDMALGGRLGHVFSLKKGVVQPSLELEYVMEDESDYTIDGGFDSPFATALSQSAEEPDTKYFSLGASVSAVFAGGRSAFFRYETLLGQDNYERDTFSLGARFEF